MPRNAGLRQKRIFFLTGLCLTLAVLSGCVSGGDPWSVSNTQPATSAPAAMIKPPAQPRAAKVGILLPLSGRGSDTGEAMLNAAQLAIFDMKAESFELIPGDTMGTPDGARSAANTVIESGAQLILGPVFASDAKAVTPLAVQRGVGMISFSTDSSVAGGTSFVLGFLPQAQIQQVLDYAGTQGMRRIALIAPHDAYGDLAASSFETHMRQRNLINSGSLRYKGNITPDQLQSLIRTSPDSSKPFDAVLIAAPASQAAIISQQLSAAGLSSALVQRLGTGLWDQPDAARQPALQGAWYAAASPQMRQRFENRYLQTYGEHAPRLATLAYDATALSIVLAKSGQPYSRAALSNPNGFSGIDGIFRFSPTGLVERSLAILEINNGALTVKKSALASFQSPNM